jgi:hypothetical protein
MLESYHISCLRFLTYGRGSPGDGPRTLLSRTAPLRACNRLLLPASVPPQFFEKLVRKGPLCGPFTYFQVVYSWMRLPGLDHCPEATVYQSLRTIPHTCMITDPCDQCVHFRDAQSTCGTFVQISGGRGNMVHHTGSYAIFRFCPSREEGVLFLLPTTIG